MRIAAIGAHLDDIEIGCGGLIADAVENGHKVKMIVMSNSSYTDFNGRILRSETIAKEEGTDAARILGVEDLEILDFPTKDIPYNSKTIEALDKIVSDFKPDIILTHWPHDTHQDHKSVSLATISACRYYNKILMYEPMMPSGRSYEGFRAQLYYSISDEGFQKKIDSLKAHKSQHQKYGGDVWIGAVKSRSIFRGYEISNKYAECFEVMRWHLELKEESIL